MGIRKENFIDGEFYHVYNAGVENITIFKDKDDFFQFLKMIKLFNNTISKGSSVNYKKNILPEKNSEEKVGWKKQEEGLLVEVLAYSLIKNHFHLVLRQISKKGISKFMQKISTGYAMYFNKKYKRSGSLYIRRFESEHVLGDDELKKVGVYVNLNYKIHDLVVESFKLTSSENINKMTYVSSWSEYMEKNEWNICNKKYLIGSLETIKKYKVFSEKILLEQIRNKTIFIKK